MQTLLELQRSFSYLDNYDYSFYDPTPLVKILELNFHLHQDVHEFYKLFLNLIDSNIKVLFFQFKFKMIEILSQIQRHY